MKKNTLSNILKVLNHRGFLSQKHVSLPEGQQLVNEYGPLGAMMRHNIFMQWWKAMVQEQSNVFAIEHPLIMHETLSSGQDSSPQILTDKMNLRNDLNVCISQYLQVLQLTNKRLPFSIASAGPCFSHQPNVKDAEEPAKISFFRGLNRTRLLLQNYTAPNKVKQAFDYWLQFRLSWWKKYARNPSNFTVLSNAGNNGQHKKDGGAVKNANGAGTATGNRLQSMGIVYEFPWGPEVIEDVTNDGPLETIHSDELKESSFMGKYSGNKSCLPHRISCRTSIESGMAAFLTDSFQERKPLAKGKRKLNTVLHLHPQISPYQVALAVDTQEPSGHELQYVCAHLEKDFQKASVSVFNASEHGGTLDAHFRRNDQLGIPYTVILSNSTLTDGILHTRQRDTEIKSATHTSMLVEELKRNLLAKLE